MSELGIYVHIPFCIVRCSYCDFNAYAGLDDLMDPYVDALVNEIKARSTQETVSTVFFGGGTPTQLGGSRLVQVLDAIESSFRVAPDAEITVEANPESSSLELFRSLHRGGFNRVSIGIQSLSPHVLRSLDRVHDASAGLNAIELAIEAGFDRVNGDLIFGTPGESFDDWVSTLRRVASSGVDHVSAYALTIEEGTPLATRVARGEPSPDEDDQADKYEICNEILTTAGFRRYEISNWSKPGGECRHNLGYWRGSNYLGIGAGAHSHRDGKRSWNVKLPRSYIDRVPDSEEGFELLAGVDRARESAILGIRTAEGIDRRRFQEQWGFDPLDRWELPEDLVTWDDSRVRLKTSGYFLAGAVARSFLD